MIQLTRLAHSSGEDGLGRVFKARGYRTRGPLQNDVLGAIMEQQTTRSFLTRSGGERR